jgi:hypothetical protein
LYIPLLSIHPPLNCLFFARLNLNLLLIFYQWTQ